MTIITILQKNKENKILKYLKTFKYKSLFCIDYYEYEKVLSILKNNTKEIFVYTDVLDCVGFIAYKLRLENRRGVIVYNTEYLEELLVTDIDKQNSSTYFVKARDFALVGENAKLELVKSCYIYTTRKMNSIYDSVNYLKCQKYK